MSGEAIADEDKFGNVGGSVLLGVEIRARISGESSLKINDRCGVVGAAGAGDAVDDIKAETRGLCFAMGGAVYVAAPWGVVLRIIVSSAVGYGGGAGGTAVNDTVGCVYKARHAADGFLSLIAVFGTDRRCGLVRDMRFTNLRGGLGGLSIIDVPQVALMESSP